ncbi:MAG: hypothetical protein DMG05_27865 [Acidobacteria bacterium]|nr:MAG: hypothetical protein DMG05_27865 [Acidobacteriota bacterium]
MGERRGSDSQGSAISHNPGPDYPLADSVIPKPRSLKKSEPARESPARVPRWRAIKKGDQFQIVLMSILEILEQKF